MYEWASYKLFNIIFIHIALLFAAVVFFISYYLNFVLLELCK